MKRLFALTWVAIGVIAWRQQSLEEAMAQFVAASNKMFQTATTTLLNEMADAMESVAARGGSSN